LPAAAAKKASTMPRDEITALQSVNPSVDAPNNFQAKSPAALRLAALAVAFGAALGSTSPGLAASPFDGAWSVVVACSDFGDVKGYTLRFPANVRGGRFSGRFVNPTDSLNYGDLTGAIAASGDALLTMNGSAGAPDLNLHHAARYSRMHYTASVHFDATSGSGKRIEERPCSLSFAKN